MKFLSIFLILFVSKSAFSQIIQVPDDSPIVQSIVQIERVAQVPGGPTIFLGVGVLVTFHHVLSPRTIYANNIVANTVILRFRGNRLGEGFTASPGGIVQHGTADLAVGRMVHRVDLHFSFIPRNRNELNVNRFCTLVGFDNAGAGLNSRALVMQPVIIRNGTECTGILPAPFCIVGTVNQFPACGGFAGASVTCDGSTVAALGIADQLCLAVNPRLSLVSLNDFQTWIDEQTSGVRGIKSGFTMMGVLLGVVLMKILM